MTMDDNKSVSATFAINTYTLTVHSRSERKPERRDPADGRLRLETGRQSQQSGHRLPLCGVERRLERQAAH